MRLGLLVCAVALTPACGDGVGQPIVERARVPSAGTSGQGASAGFGGNVGGRSSFPPFAGNGPGRGSAGQGGVFPPEGECSGIAEWPLDSNQAEDEFLEALNYARELGTTCAQAAAGSEIPPLTMSAALRCSARLHSRDMVERQFFDRVNPDGVGPEDRMRRAGATFRVAGESIARSETGDIGMFPWREFEELFDAGGSECENLTDPSFDAVGIGLFEGYWTLDFTGP